METAFSIGLLSCGFLILAPMLALGLKSARLARDDRESAQIAQTLMEDARQGTLGSGTLYLDGQGNNCGSNQAAYSAQSATATLAPSLSRVTLRVTPVGAPDRMRTYVVVVSSAQ